jgi:hypothetical protein
VDEIEIIIIDIFQFSSHVGTYTEHPESLTFLLRVVYHIAYDRLQITFAYRHHISQCIICPKFENKTILPYGNLSLVIEFPAAKVREGKVAISPFTIRSVMQNSRLVGYR